MSQHIDQSKVALAEADVRAAYLLPLGVTDDIASIANSDPVAKDALMCLVFLLVLQRTTFATRAGSKEKTTAQSMQADRWAIYEQWAATCQQKVQVLAARQGVAKPWRVCGDICGIYYNTHFIGL